MMIKNKKSGFSRLAHMYKDATDHDRRGEIGVSALPDNLYARNTVEWICGQARVRTLTSADVRNFI